MIWACFEATGTEHLMTVESTMKLSVYQTILEANEKLCVQRMKLKLGHATGWKSQANCQIYNYRD